MSDETLDGDLYVFWSNQYTIANAIQQGTSEVLSVADLAQGDYYILLNLSNSIILYNYIPYIR